MSTTVVATPDSCLAVHPHDAVAIERWAAGQRAQLRLLERRLRAILDERATLLTPVGQDDGSTPEQERAIRAQLDGTLDAERRRLAAAAESARAEAAAVVARAVTQATDLLLEARAGAASVQRVVGIVERSRPEVPGAGASEPAVVIDLDHGEGSEALLSELEPVCDRTDPDEHHAMFWRGVELTAARSSSRAASAPSSRRC